MSSALVGHGRHVDDPGLALRGAFHELEVQDVHQAPIDQVQQPTERLRRHRASGELHRRWQGAHLSRLSATDAFWMNAEPDGSPFAIGSLVVLEGPGPSLSDLRALVADRLGDAERMRQRLQVDPRGLRHPRWVPAEPDLDHHAHHGPARFRW